MFLYFKESPKWSAAMALAIASIAGDGAEFGEINWAGSRLKSAAESGDTEAWHEVWSDLAGRVERLADRATKVGDHIEGCRAYLRACTYFQMAERFLRPNDERKCVTFGRSLECFKAAGNFSPIAIERAEIPYEGSYLPAIFVPPTRSTKAPYPVVIFFGGLDSTKEQLFFFVARQLAEHGMGVLIVDGPGNGESLRFLGHHSRFDYEVPTRAVVNWLMNRSDADRERIGLLAVSLGGYYAARSAAFETRLAATAAWGAIWDYHAMWLKRSKLNAGSAGSADHEHVSWVVGAKDFDDALRILERYKLDGVAQRINIPFFTLHGGADRQVPVSDAHRFHDALGSKDKTLLILEEEDFGDQHSQIDNMSIARLHLFSWLRKRLVRTVREVGEVQLT